MKIFCPISVGEYIDKLSILQIKKNQIRDNKKLLEIKKEICELKKIYPKNLPNKDSLFTELQNLNISLWKNMSIRKKIVSQNKTGLNLWKIFQSESLMNDKRYLVKKSIDEKYYSAIKEQKSYPWL